MFRIASAILLLCAVLTGQSPSPDQMAKIFAEYKRADSPGCAAGVEGPGGSQWAGAYGMADLEHAVANTPATVFEAGSVSKQFTAAAVLLLAERGQVSLGDNIRKYFLEMAEYERPITVRHLLDHTSGLRDWGEVEYLAGWPRTTRDYTHAHVLDIITRQHSLNYAPGEAWSYTNSGYNLAAMLVERVSGTTLQAFCRREFFEPLGMASTQWRDDFRRIVLNRAIAYDKRGSEWRQDMPFEDIYGNGGLLTTVGDLLKWNRNMATGKLHGSVFDSMQKPSQLNQGLPVRYGLGLFLYNFEGFAEISHSGATAGYRAWLGRIPEKGISVAVLCNAGSADATGMAHQLAELFLDGLKRPALPRPVGVVQGLYRNERDHGTVRVESVNDRVTFDGTAVQGSVRFERDRMMVTEATYGEDVWEHVESWTPTDLRSYAGVYTSEEAETVLRVGVENGKLVIHRRPDSSFPLEPTYADAFKCELGSVRFMKDAKGKVVALSLSESRVWDLRFARE